MANKKNQKHEHQPEQKTSEQPTAPATPLELSEEELGQVTGGIIVQGPSAPAFDGGLPTVN